MVEDIVPELLKKIQLDFEDDRLNSSTLQFLISKLDQ